MTFFSSKKISFFAVVLIIFFSAVFTASADFNTTMDSTLSEESLSYGSASYALLVGTEVISDDATVQEAAGEMSKMFPDTAMEWNEPVTIAGFSYMIMNAYSLEGGLFYRIFPGPRYALRELKFKKIIQEKAYSTMYLSGEKAFRIIGRVLDREEAENAE